MQYLKSIFLLQTEAAVDRIVAAIDTFAAAAAAAVKAINADFPCGSPLAVSKHVPPSVLLILNN